MQDEPVVGRDVEAASLTRFLGDVLAGPAGLLLEGEAGIGKTTLWKQGVASAERCSFHVLSCRPTGSEAQLSFAALGDLLSEVADELLAGLPDPQRRALDVALLRVAARGRPPDRRAVSVAVLHVIRALSETAPALIAVDDVQWLDVPSARVLEFVIRRLRGEPVGVLATIRPSRDPPPLTIERLAPEGRLDRVELGPLSVGALHHVLRGRLGAPIARHTLVRLHRASGGNPFFALEIARALSPDGRDPRPGEPFPVPESLRRAVRDRLDSLPARVRETLLVAASLGQPTPKVVESVTGRPEALAKAVRAGVVELDGERIRFTHPLLASVVMSSPPPARRRQVARRLAAVLDDPEERARHLALGAEGPDDGVAEALDVAAGAARAWGAPDAAAELGELAVETTPADRAGDRRRRTVQAAEDRFTAGDVQKARALLEEAAAGLPAGPERADVLSRLARVRYHGEGFRGAAELLAQALNEAGGDVRLRVTIEQQMVFVAANLGDALGAEAHAAVALDLVARLDDPVLLAHVLEASAMTQFLRGRGIPRETFRRADALGVAPGDLSPELRPDVMTGRLLGWACELDEGRPRLERAYAYSLDRGEEDAVAIVAFYLAELECWAGRWERARELARTALETSRLVGNDALHTYALYATGLVQALSGEIDAARATARRGSAWRSAWPRGQRCCSIGRSSASSTSRSEISTVRTSSSARSRSWSAARTSRSRRSSGSSRTRSRRSSPSAGRRRPSRSSGGSRNGAGPWTGRGRSPPEPGAGAWCSRRGGAPRRGWRRWIAP